VYRTKPRVLVEEPGAKAGTSNFALFRQAGFDVTTCTGPDADVICPLTRGEPCPLADEADVILFGLDLDSAEVRRILRAHYREHPRTPIVIEGASDRYADIVTSAPNRTMVRSTTSVPGQIRALWKAVLAGRTPA
jgi:hypothetical protein